MDQNAPQIPELKYEYSPMTPQRAANLLFRMGLKKSTTDPQTMQDWQSASPSMYEELVGMAPDAYEAAGMQMPQEGPDISLLMEYLQSQSSELPPEKSSLPGSQAKVGLLNKLKWMMANAPTTAKHAERAAGLPWKKDDGDMSAYWGK